MNVKDGSLEQHNKAAELDALVMEYDKLYDDCVARNMWAEHDERMSELEEQIGKLEEDTSE